MLNTPFSHKLLEKYVIIFGTLFNNITITRNNDQEEFKVPLSYGPREKHLARLKADPEIKREVAITLPRIAFEVTSLTYAPERKMNSIDKMVMNLDSKNKLRVRNPVPYDISMQVVVMGKTIEETTQIVEQILPLFTPDFTISAKLLDDMPDLSLDIPIILNGVNQEDVYDGDFVQRRAITWTLDFTIKALFFGPVKEQKVIKLVKANLRNENKEFETIQTRPGLTDRGTPTSFADSELVQATAKAVVDNGKIVDIIPETIGIGYENAIVTIDPPTSGIQAYVEPIIQNGILKEYKIVNQGSGYTSTPNVVISSPDMASISYLQIDEFDNYGYIVEIINN